MAVPPHPVDADVSTDNDRNVRLEGWTDINQALRAYASRFGPVQAVTVQRSSNGKLNGFVLFASAAGAQALVAASGSQAEFPVGIAAASDLKYPAQISTYTTGGSAPSPRVFIDRVPSSVAPDALQRVLQRVGNAAVQNMQRKPSKNAGYDEYVVEFDRCIAATDLEAIRDIPVLPDVSGNSLSLGWHLPHYHLPLFAKYNAPRRAAAASTPQGPIPTTTMIPYPPASFPYPQQEYAAHHIVGGQFMPHPGFMQYQHHQYAQPQQAAMFHSVPQQVPPGVYTQHHPMVNPLVPTHSFQPVAYGTQHHHHSAFPQYYQNTHYQNHNSAPPLPPTTTQFLGTSTHHYSPPFPGSPQMVMVSPPPGQSSQPPTVSTQWPPYQPFTAGALSQQAELQTPPSAVTDANQYPYPTWSAPAPLM